MTAYVIADVTLTGNPDELAAYQDQVAATLEPFGGRYLARGGATHVLEGDWNPGRIVIVEFPDMASAFAWQESPAYQQIAPLRIRNTSSRRLVVEGL